MNIVTIIQQPEGRSLEFKEDMPTNAELSKTILAFANDAGGIIVLGVKDKPRTVIGLAKEKCLQIEEQISNIIHDKCTPTILPEIEFLEFENEQLLVLKIYKGSNPPYYLKQKDSTNSTFIRVGSSNRLANIEIIEDLKRQKQGVSFDGLPVFNTDVVTLKWSSFANHFEEKTGDTIDAATLNKLQLVQTEQGKTLASNALVLLSDDNLRNKLFPNAKIECARFKGTVPGDFIDQKTIDEPPSLQAAEAYKFVLRHISQGADYEGVYRKDRWEYPIIAIRELIRNAVIHRDYSLKGKDIKVAIFDDKIEITSPGKLLPTVDFNEMEAGQSDVRNKVLAPVFKKLGIIEKWGNGLQLIADELKLYPEIDLKWSEPGMAFRVSFIKKKQSLANDYDRLRPITTDCDRLRTIEYGRTTNSLILIR